MVLARKRRGGTGVLYTFASFSGQSDFAAQKSCVCAVAHITKSACPTAAKSVCCHTLPHRRVRRQPLSRASRKQRYNTLDFAKQNRVPTGRLAPLLETQRQRDIPFAIPYFPRWCIYKLQNAACNACSENAKGSLCGCVAQTSFRAEMQKKGTAVSSAFPRSARQGREIMNGENLNIAKCGMVLSENPPVLLYYRLF